MSLSIELKEVINSITQHKMRNALTGFGIAWGIFILMLMMGFGDSFQKGIFNAFSSYSENTLWVVGGRTSIDFKGEISGKQILFDEEILTKVKNRFSEVEHISPEVDAPESMKITYDDNFTMGRLKGIGSDYFAIKKLKLGDGRLFNHSDIENELPVCILSESLKKIVFKGKKKIIGENINIGGNYFRVVGISKPGNMFDGSERTTILIPYKYYVSLFNLDALEYFVLSLRKDANNKSFNRRINRYLSMLYEYDPEDPKAIFLYSLSDQVESFQTLFIGVKIFIWFIGFCILLTGIISVGNIMYVNINERTREIGIRKALGATPRNILDMILVESIILTSISGIFGMCIGYVTIASIQYWISSSKEDNMFLTNIGIDTPVIIGSLIILICSGVIAGLIPAIKASKIRPVIALNQEN
ncbi:MAG: ABC transporter permease [Chitinophagales bacterium]|jgi:putative ABC transport system permease protein